MRKRINILQVVKRITQTGKGVNDVTDANDGQVYTVWDPDFSGQLFRGNVIDAEVVYGTWKGRKTQTLRPVGASKPKSSVNNELLYYLLAVCIKIAKKENVDSDSVDALVDGLKNKFEGTDELPTPQPTPQVPPAPLKTIQIEDEIFEEDEAPAVPKFNKPLF